MKLTRSFRALVVLAVEGGVASAGLGATSATLNNLDSGSGSISAGVATYYGFSYGGVTLDSTVVATASVDGSGNSVITFTRTSGTWTETDGNSVVTFHVDFSTPILTTGLNFLG